MLLALGHRKRSVVPSCFSIEWQQQDEVCGGGGDDEEHEEEEPPISGAEERGHATAPYVDLGWSDGHPLHRPKTCWMPAARQVVI